MAQRESHIHERQSEPTGFSGSVTGMSLVEVVQMFNLARRTVTVFIEGATSGRIDFEMGTVVHAMCGATEGEAAFRTLLLAQGGRFRVALGTPSGRSITQAFEKLMMSCLAFDDGNDMDVDGIDALRSWMPPSMSSKPPPPVVITQRSALSPKTALDEACRALVECTDGATACYGIDLKTAVILGEHFTDQSPQSLGDAIALAVVELFRGPGVSRLEGERKALEPGDGHAAREVSYATDKSSLFATTIHGDDAVLLLCAQRTLSAGMGWALLRRAVESIAPLVY